MGTYSKGILGPFSGKVGTVIGSTWKGIDYMRSLPKPSGKAPSDAQMEQRVKLSLAVNFLKPISKLLAVGFNSVAGKNTGFNVATSQVVKEAILGSLPDYEIDYAKVLISRGDLTGPWNAAVLASPGEIAFSWTNNSGSGTASDSDKAVVLIYNANKNQYVYDLAAATRKEAILTMALPADFAGDTLHAWMAFISNDGKSISTSIYLGNVVADN